MENSKLEKQIEEMACDICLVKHICNEPNKPVPCCYALNCAKRGFEKGYRKADEVAREIFEEIENNAFAYGVNFVISKKTVAELKKKYTEEGK